MSNKCYLLLMVVSMFIGGNLFNACAINNEKKEDIVLSFTKDISEDATPSVLRALMNADKKMVREIRFEKGTYHFYPDKALEKFCFISNHEDVRAHTAFPIMDMENVTIDGQGAEFIFHGIMIPFLIENSKNITVKNVSVDWAMPFHSEGLVVANDPVKGTFDLQISDAYPYEIRNEQVYFIKEYYEHTIGQSILYDPERNAIAFDTETYTPITTRQRTMLRRNINNIKYKYEIDPRDFFHGNLGAEYRIKAEELKPGLVRIYNHIKKLPPVGTVLVGKGEKGLNRVAPAFRVVFTEGFNANNVNVHHAGGMGLIAENSKDLILDKFNVTPSNGRMVSTTADATHFVGCRGKVQLLNCTFNNQLDDATNVHGTYQKVRDLIDEYTIGIYVGHFEQQNFSIGLPGDSIGLVRLSNSFAPYDALTLKNIQKLNGRYQLVTFNEKIPESLKVGDLIENLSAYPELFVDNCNISRNRARGLLISTPRKTIISNNYFHTEMEAILVPVESGFWYESGSAGNVTITNNIFQDCNHSGFNRGIFRFVTDDDNENIAFKNIVISNNQINQFDNMVLEISNTDGLVFEGNSISHTETFPMLFPENPAIVVKSSKNIKFDNNKYMGKAKQILQSDLKDLNFK